MGVHIYVQQVGGVRVIITMVTESEIGISRNHLYCMFL